MALTYWEYQLLIYTLAWLGGFLPLWAGWAPRWRWYQCVGLALVLTPFIRMGIGVYFDLTALVATTISGGYVVLPAYTQQELWLKVWRHSLYYFLVPAFGLFLVWNGRVTPRRLAAAGLAPMDTPARDALHGFALFFIIAVAYVGAMVITFILFPGLLLATGDESQVWANITIPLIILLSGVAGVTEEFLFRGLLLRTLSRAMPWAAAALLQAVLFGLVHAGYMTWAHVIGPFAFGLAMAWVTRVLGVIPAVLLHAEVNIAFFAFDVADVEPAAWGLLAALAALNVYAAYVTRLEALKKLWRSLVPRRAAPAEPMLVAERP